MSVPKIVIYGITQQAQQLCSYIRHDGCAHVCAFTADTEYKTCDTLCGIDVIDFDKLTKRFPPQEYQMAISFAYQHMVQDRENKFLQCKDLGYKIFTFISKDAIVYTQDIGEGCIIYPGCMISHGVCLGKGNFLEVGVTIAHDTTVGSFNFFAPTVTVCGGVEIEHNCFLGAHATILNNGNLKAKTLVAAGAVVRNTEENRTYFPTRTTKWHSTSDEMKI